MKTPVCANFVLQGTDSNDKVFLITVIEETRATIEVQDSVDNLLGVIELTIKEGQVITIIKRIGYKEKAKYIKLFTL
ncbi:MAG: hypothetical protein HC908_13140 [Calothrix sp. SM1_7_51]|nr:hypothetical protein [Calothrix sp. SM1_7_51]